MFNQNERNEVKNAINQVKKHIKKNRDLIDKEVGDRVIFWDLSRLVDVNNEDYVELSSTEEAMLTNYPSIVIEAKERFSSIVLGKAFTLDLIVWNKQLDRRFRTSSEFVKLHKQIFLKTKKPAVKKQKELSLV